MKLKCIKCGLRFRDRNDPEDGTSVDKTLCWNCRFIWKYLRITLQSFNNAKVMLRKPLNREVILKLDDVIIRKPK